MAGFGNINRSTIKLGSATSIMSADGFHSADVENVTATQI